MYRDFVEPAPAFDGKSVLVTGGTGSLGKALVRTVLGRFRPKRLIVFSRDELKQYEMAQSLINGDPTALRFFIGDVRDLDRLRMAMRGVDFVVHAAALKQIPTAEYNPFEYVKTNIMGAQNVVEAAIENGVKRVIALSTDKAANPANLYGATKLASDKIFIAANNLSGPVGTRFAVVRYGNVVNSRGSVIPYFNKLVAENAPHIPITDTRMTRFWITLQQAVSFVLSSLAMLRGGETFVPRIPSMKIVEMAAALAPGLPHEVIGIRPGEKLHEIMITEESGRDTIALDDRYIVEPAFAFWSRQPYLDRGAREVPASFSYTSDNNDEWLDEAEFLNLLRHAGITLARS